MAIIAALERSPRGPYCGALGYVAPPGSAARARFAVAIRTAVADHALEICEYGVGSGITWYSDAASEWAELMDKAAVLGWPMGG